MRVIKFLVFTFLGLACTNEPKVITSISKVENPINSFRCKDSMINLYLLCLKVPPDWQMRNLNEDSRIGDATARYVFENSKGKQFYLEYGLGTNGNPAEPNVVSYRFRKNYIVLKLDTLDIIFSDNPKLASQRRKSGYIYSLGRISGFEAEFYKPIKGQDNYFGVYIDSIGTVGKNIADFTFYAKDLDSLEFQEMKTVISSFYLSPFN